MVRQPRKGGCRQRCRPCLMQAASANGTIFVTLEDETGSANQIVWPSIAEKFLRAVFAGKLLTGTLQSEGRVIDVIAKTLYDWSAGDRPPAVRSVGFCAALRPGR